MFLRREGHVLPAASQQMDPDSLCLANIEHLRALCEEISSRLVRVLPAAHFLLLTREVLLGIAGHDDEKDDVLVDVKWTMAVLEVQTTVLARLIVAEGLSMRGLWTGRHLVEHPEACP